MNAVEVNNLSKTYGETKAVQGISFNIPQGKIYSLLGPNGAGKTTTISMLSSLITPDQGKITIMGIDLNQNPLLAKKHLGVVPQEIALYEDLSALENLRFWGKMSGLRGKILNQRIDQVLDMIGLRDRQKERVGKFSGGMKRRVNIGIALLHHPDVLYMDEPTVGIDPQSRRHILDSIKYLNEQGMTILYTTHYMEEAEELSDLIAIMDQGKIIAEGKKSDLLRIIGEYEQLTINLSQNQQSVMQSWSKFPEIQKIKAHNGSLELITQDSNQLLPLLFETTTTLDTRITGIDIQEPNLEAVFLHLTGKALRD